MRTSDGNVAVSRSEIASIGTKTEFGNRRAPGTRPHLHDTGHGIGSVQGALCATYELKEIRLRQRQSTKVKRATRLVDGDAIDNHLVVSGVAAANEERGQ